MREAKISSFILFIFLISLFSGCFESSEEDVGDNFTFTALDGSLKSLKDYRGKFVLVDFFGVNCQPCMYQMYVLSQIYEDYNNEEIVVISIDAWIAYGETIDLIEQYISSAKEQEVYLNWTFGVDDTDGTLLNKYASNGVPMLYLFDKNGKIYYSNVGYTEYIILSEKIDDLINSGS